MGHVDDMWAYIWRHTQPECWPGWEKIMPPPQGAGAKASARFNDDRKAEERHDALMYMADWFQRAAVGSCIHSFTRTKEFLESQSSRPRGPHSDYTLKVDRAWDTHDQVHGPLFEIKTAYRISETAQLCAKKPFNFDAQLKSETFERHALECANQILHSVGALSTVKTTTEVCPTCSALSVRSVDVPSWGSGFVERVGRLPNPETDRWRLMYRFGQLIRWVQKDDVEGYYSSMFRLVIDWAGAASGTGEGGRPYYWRLDPRPWYRK